MQCCLQPLKTKKSSGSKIKAHLSIRSKNKAKLSAIAEIKAQNSNLPSFTPSIKGYASINAALSIRLAAKSVLTSKAELRPHLSQIFNLNDRLAAQAEIKAKAAKFSGDFRPNDCYDKLYPTQDVSKLNLIGMSGNTPVSDNLYELVNEGVYAGDYHLHEKQSDSLFSYDDFIKSSGDSDHTEYTVNMSLPSVSFTESYVVFNAQAFNSKQKIYEIQFRDEEDNLICEYEDIEFVGDNYPTMYSSKPRINNGAEYTWSAKYPKVPSSGCTLSFKTQASCIEDADGFDDGFDEGFEKCSVLHNPEIRISAVEICNSGDFGFRHENFLPAFVGVRAKGDRLERCIDPISVLPYNFDTDVWPEVQSVWENTYGYSNQVESEGRVLALDLSKPYDYTNITLTSSTIEDSGKLNLLFSHKPQEFVFGFKNGSFGLGFSDREFDVAKPFKQKDNNEFFVVDEIYLKVRAKKAEGSRDFALDVVGWSDDNLLNVTSQVGGFLQNTSGVGVVPLVSGWNNLDNEGISSEAISEQDEYYEHESLQGSGSDHYKLSPSIVNSTSYRDYEVPLVIEVDEFKLGLQDRSSASFFEKLFVDIYPIPSGASISSAELCVRYTPSNALHFTTLAGDIGRIELDRKEGKFFPTTRTANDLPVNREAVSLIENIPHGYESPDTLKSNYARRWRGVEGIVSGPFDPNQFGFGFEAKQLDSPFVLGHFDFTHTSGSSLFSRPLTNLSPIVGTSFGMQIEQNIGFRFKSPSLVTTSNPYQSIDWNGNIVDAYDSVARLVNNISFPAQDLSEGFAFYLRFSPDENASGDSTILLKDGVSLSFDYDNNQFSAMVSAGAPISSTPKVDPVFPVSVILTYNDNGSQKSKLYVKFENSEVEKYENTAFARTDTPGQIFVTPAKNLYHEIALSNGTGSGVNLVDGDEVSPNLLYKQQTAQSFLNAQSVHWTDSSGIWQDDSYILPSYIDEDTLDWDLGAFNWKEFTPYEYDMFTKRVGRDAINFRLRGDGVPYSEKTDLAFPSTLDSSVSYHTQAENDFLRINLTDSLPNFYSAAPRIQKTLPRGYDFAEKAFVVDSIISYSQSGEIVWPDGNIGPKLIVSVYTRNQEDEEIGTHNWGLINRKSHYLNPNNRWSKLESTFDLESLLDESEKWSIFPEERRLTEFNHKYFSKDVDEMFLQYDLVTPSGDEFEVNLNIHSANVRLENAFVKPSLVSNSLNVFTSGEQYSYSNMPMYVDPIGLEIEAMNLHLSGVPTPTDLGEVSLCTSGAYFEVGGIDLTTINKQFISTGGTFPIKFIPVFNESGALIPGEQEEFQDYYEFNGSEVYPLFDASGFVVKDSGGKIVEDPSGTIAIDKDGIFHFHLDRFNQDPGGLFLSTSGNFRVESQMNLFLENDNETLPFDIFLPLHMFGTATNPDLSRRLGMVSYSSVGGSQGAISGVLPMKLIASRGPQDVFADSAMPMFTHSPTKFGEDMNLFLFGEENPGLRTDSFMSLYSKCFPLVYLNGSGDSSLSWNSKNVGRNTEEVDEDLLTVPSIDLIRGTQTICWGECSAVDDNPCVEQDIITHDTNWANKECVDGGILRPSNPYRNSDVYAFGNESAGRYNGHFYGSRKYQGLLPNTPYSISVIGKKGDKTTIGLPPQFEEWEYGTLGDIDFEGFKHVAEERNQDDKYGKCVRVKNDLMGVGAPGHDLGVYKEAGSIFLYRRQEEEGGEKKPWDLETKLTLPSGFIGDWYYDRGGSISFPGIGTIPEKQWNIGQEGRELGHSFDIAVTDDREVIVAGGPGAKWDTRGFEEIETSGVNVAIMVFNNEFSYTQEQIKKIMDNVDIHNFLYKYFAEPAVNINLKIISCIPTGIFQEEVYTEPGIDNLVVQKIPRSIPSRPEDPAKTADMLSGIKSAFFEAFPYDNSQVNNNIPPIVGFYVDDSRSLGRPVVEPAIDQFVNFYKDYSFQSGVKDFYNNPASGYIYEYTPTESDEGEDWFTISNKLVNDLLDTGNLYNGGHHTLITSGVGLEFANEQAVDFNLNPDSGGRVYVFEKEFGDWSLMQEIKSPASSPDKLPARFGHSVSISDDGLTFAIGSPFIRESCLIYEFRDGEKDRLYNNIGRWLKFRNNATVTIGQYFGPLIRYEELTDASGSFEAGKQVYSELSRTDKFKSRSDYDFWGNNPIQEYRQSFKYGLNDVEAGLTGTFTKTMRKNAPNPRLGYSTAVSEDGNVVAFGAPTDSLGQYDDAGFYFLHQDGEYLSESGDPEFPRNLWASNVNAGAVRIFEKDQNFEPISERKVLEYNKFGNLSNTINNTEGYDEQGNETNSTAISQNRTYGKTDFGDTSIPKDVGSIFIITPEIDAANDEVIEEIKQWMSLGDRRLVLVGDDPVWEKNGAYAKSNDIINKILEKLDSRMRLHPARNEREALIANTSCSGEDIAPNIIKSYTPQGSNSTNVQIDQPLFGYGVADIRLHVPNAVFKENEWGKDHSVVNNKRYGNCSFYNPKCGPPIAHNGDLRARWIERELLHPPNPEAKDPYTYWERNLPFEFYSNGLPKVKPEEAVKIAKDLSLGGQGEQPRPLMVAAEFSENYATIPARPEIISRIPILEEVCQTSNSSLTYYLFGDSHLDEVAFIWSEDSGNYNFVDTNIGNNFSEGTFYNPPEFNGRDGLLQANGTLDIEVTREELTEYFEVGEPVNYVAKEGLNGSEVYLIASTHTETQAALQFGNDENISFYDNLVRNPNNDNAFIVQLGGWTNRNSFADANNDSLLSALFFEKGHDVVEGWTGTIPASKDVVWIANALGEPTQADIDKLVTWMSHGNKRLVITYEKEEEQSSKAYRLCEKLGLGMKPWYLSGANKFPTTANRTYISRDLREVLLDSEDQSIESADGQFPVREFAMDGATYCPIDLRSGGSPVVWHNGVVKDERLQVTEEYKDVWSMNTGVAKVQFPAIPGSGYRIFYNWIADRPEEKQNIDLYVGDVLHKIRPTTRAGNPATVTPNGNTPIKDYDVDRDLKIVDYASTQRINLESPSFGTAISKGYLDVQVPHDKDYINIFLTGNRNTVKANGNQVPTTYKFLSVSGAPLPINSVTEFYTSEQCESIEVGYNEVVTQEYVPPKTVLLPATVKPIMNDNTRYCLTSSSCGGKLVADGPVVMAEEPEHFSDGAVGNSRSKILLISDSTIVNGCVGADTGEATIISGVPTVSKNTLLARVDSFLDSLTTTETTLVGDKTTLNLGYKFSEKIVSPEKGSPAIYSIVQANMGARFGGSAGGSLEQFGHEKDFEQGKMIQNIHEKMEEFEEAEKAVLGEFDGSVGTFGNPRFLHDGYEDAPMSGNPFSDLFRDTGKDFLDYDVYSGLYPGDLFGHSLDIHNGQLIVGSPFSAYVGDEISSISGISSSGNSLETGNEGGGGSAYVFEKTIQFGWNTTKKLKPQEIRTFNNSDRLGWSISMDGDFVAISAPGHDFGNSVEYNKGAFVRKEFSAAFDIGTRTVTSLGSGENPVSNNTGAVFTFENKLYNWSNRSKSWEFSEKLLPHGYASGEDTSSFGDSVSISRFARRDSDYAMSVGSHRHTFGIDNNDTQESGAGAAYAYDAMLRNQPPSTFSQESWLKASVFGLNRELDEVNIEVNQLGDFKSREEIIAKGLIYSDSKGQIFLEASGQDPRELGFIVQRPYIERVEGEIVHGTPVENTFSLTSYTDPFDFGDNLNLFMLGQESDIVYNTLDMSTFSAYTEIESGVPMLVKADSPTSLDTSGITLHTTASGIVETSLDLRVRGK